MDAHLRARAALMMTHGTRDTVAWPQMHS
jgi:hypothetical protein